MTRFFNAFFNHMNDTAGSSIDSPASNQELVRKAVNEPFMVRDADAPVGPPVGGPPPMPAAVLFRNAFLEGVMTAVLLFIIVTAVRWVVGEQGVARAIGSVNAQVAVVAALAAAAVLAIILSPGGRRSGAHVNPAVTVALWQMRAFPARAVVPYVVAQLIGSLIGVGAARLAWGGVIADSPTRYGAVGPARGWQWWEVASVEAACLVVVTLIIGYFLAHPESRIRKALPYALSTVTFAIAAGLGTLSGASVNPARQLGPALWSGEYAFLLWYLVAPVVGALVGARIHLWLVRQPVQTYKLSGDQHH